MCPGLNLKKTCNKMDKNALCEATRIVQYVLKSHERWAEESEIKVRPRQACAISPWCTWIGC